MESYVVLKNILIKEKEKEILNIEKFSLNKGDIVGLMGENGASKSTLLRVLMLLQKPQKGEILFNGLSDFDIQNERRQIALVFQESLLFKGSVEDNIAYPLKLRKVPKQEIKKICANLIEEFEIANLRNKQALKLSGGEAKRVCLARALAYQPSLLLLDEPFNDLDTRIRRKIETKLFSYLKSNNISAVFVSHDFEDIARFCTRLAVMQKGKIIRQGTLSEVLEEPQQKVVADILGNTSFINAEVRSTQDGIVKVQAGRYEFRVAHPRVFLRGQKVFLNLRPEDVFISNNDAFKNSSIRNSYRAKITDIVDNHSFIRIKLKSGFISEAIITKQSMEELNIKKGKIITAGFKATAARLMSCEE